MELSFNKSLKQQSWNAMVKLFTLFIVFYLIVFIFSVEIDKKVDMHLIVSIIYALSLLVSTIDDFKSLWHIRDEKTRYYFIGLVPFYIFSLYKAIEYKEFFSYKVDFYFTMLYGVTIIPLMIRHLVIKQFKKA